MEALGAPIRVGADALRLHEYYDPQTVAHVQRYFHEDFRRFHYSTSFPRVEAACGSQLHDRHQRRRRSR